MPIVPIRDLARYGVITDPDPYDLPIGAWSFAVNARFRNNKITRGPVWRNVYSVSGSPRFILGAENNAGNDDLYVGLLSGQIQDFVTGSGVDVSLIGYSPVSTEATWTGTHLANVTYINRQDRPPWYRRTSDATFQNLAAAAGTSPWNALWTTNILRASNGALCAFNVTKSGINFPTMVKTSGFPLSGNVPDSWDQTNPASSATENILAEMESPILDALPLGSLVFIYGQNETWLMQFVGGTFIWQYNKQFYNRGIINTNCVVEVNRQHVVFGPDDIWLHDGVNQKSICDGRTREFIFSGINQTAINRCFVVHNADLKEVMFCYYSGDSYSMYYPSATTGCNRSATWNYDLDTWTFDDLPLVYSGTRANLTSMGATWATVTATWANVGGTWQSLEGNTTNRSTIFVSAGDATYGWSAPYVYAFDPTGPLSKVTNAVDPLAPNRMFLFRNGIDLDELGVELRGYKIVQSIYPQGRLDGQSAPLQFSIGGADYFNDPPTYQPYQTYDGDVLYKLDYREPGRYLAIQVLYPDYHFVSISGIDVDLQVQGMR